MTYTKRTYFEVQPVGSGMEPVAMERHGNLVAVEDRWPDHTMVEIGPLVPLAMVDKLFQ